MNNTPQETLSSRAEKRIEIFLKELQALSFPKRKEITTLQSATVGNITACAHTQLLLS